MRASACPKRFRANFRRATGKILWKASAALKKAKIYIDDSSKISPAEILSKCRRLKTRKDGLDMIMIDYIQLMEMGGRLIENRQQEIANITRNLKIMAKELDVPVLALSQLRRISSKEGPQSSDLENRARSSRMRTWSCLFTVPTWLRRKRRSRAERSSKTPRSHHCQTS